MGRKIQTELSKKVLSLLEEGVMPWRSDRGIPTNPKTGAKYSGINILLLDAIATERKYSSKFWATYDQWYQIGLQVRRRPAGEDWGVYAVSWQDNVMKKHVLFNAEQVFGRTITDYLNTNNSNTDYAPLNLILNATGAKIVHDKSCPFPQYVRNEDFIFLPEKDQFIDIRQYTATQIHEMFHWAESRLNWTGPEDQGELIAEIGTGYLESDLGLPHDADMANCNKWMPYWIKGIKKSPKYLFESAAQAARALEFICSFNYVRSVLQSDKIVVESGLP
jgi:antirestriction protein ArdC